VDLMALLGVEVINPGTRGYPGHLQGLTGQQVGMQGQTRARVQVEEITAFDSAALARELTCAARQVRSPAAILEETLQATDPPDEDPPAISGPKAV
jgi:hypothetical protein